MRRDFENLLNQLYNFNFRNNVMASTYQERNRNFCLFLRRFIRIPPSSKAQFKEFLEEVKACKEIAEKKWLMDKISLN